jgi:peptidoglycan/LPS O-acetylase OafA/YrhL
LNTLSDRVAGHATIPPNVRSALEKAGPPDRTETKHFNYLAFLDGLRAISILAVVAFHMGVPGVSGGYVGVDVFFVISGFLIINQIKDGLTSGRFSIFSFYANRTLRILPPFLIMVAVVDIVAPFVLRTAATAWDFLPSAGLAPLMVSNIVFLVTQGYFDISAVEKPLLHTWTLSVEEQFYLFAPLLLPLLFWLGNRRFGPVAAAVGLVLAAVSIAAAAAPHVSNGLTAAFYLPPYRAWEFLAGGFIGAPAASAMRALPRRLVDLIGWVGIGCILIAVSAFDAATPYPSWNAALPVAGATLALLSGFSDPTTTVARFLSLRWLVAIGLVSYGWYLWHWPILSFMRTMRLDESSLLYDSLGGGLLAFVLACVSYRYVEQPIRRWRKSSANLKRPERIVLSGVVACSVLAALGGAGAWAGYLSTRSFLASRYGTEGRGTLENGCHRVSRSGLPDKCFESGPVGIVLGDSHASMLVGSFARSFDALGIRLVSVAGPSCYPTLFAPEQRKVNRQHRCARAIAPFERLLAGSEPVRFVIISAHWRYDESALSHLSDLISQFDPEQTRILLIGQVPDFPKSSLECVVYSDLYGDTRDRCVTPRSAVEARYSAITAALKAMPDRFGNVRYIDPLDLFCDATTCRPFDKDAVFFEDTNHVTPRGADAIYDAFAADFLWLADNRD